jgi:hypothetical protein
MQLKTILAALLATLIWASGAFGQTSLYYKEIARDGKVYVFNTPEKLAQFEKSGEFGTNVTMVNQGPSGETIVAENETALDLYNFKHDRPGYERPAPKPEKSVIPTTLKVGSEGELKFSILLQPWYVTDSSPAGTTTSYYGNTTGLNSFRIRRAEIKLTGKISKAWGFEVMLDPAKTQSFTASGVAVTDDKVLQDLAVTFLGLKGQEISLGQKKITVTEEGLRSSSELDFGERARMTRTFSDRRETGLFYKGELGEYVAAYASVTNGTPANVVDDSNDTVFGATRVDVKPMHGMVLGGSGGTSSGETLAHLGRSLYGAHFKWDPADLPIAIRAEYLAARTGQVGKDDLRRNGFYGTVLYNITKQYQLGARFDRINNNSDVSGNKIDTWTFGFHWLPLGKNVNFKLDWYHVKQEGRTINGDLAESYNQVILHGQLAF